MPLQLTYENDLALLRMEMPRGNAISRAFLGELGRALDDVEASPARALVMTGQGKVFCTGLDLVEAFELDREALVAFVRDFDEAFARLFAFPKPVVAAVNGHAIAGGCIVACAADWRVMEPGPFLIGVTEAQVGIPFPVAAMEIVRHSVAPAAWTETFLEGKRWTVEDAQRIGLVQRIAGERGAWAEAIEKAATLAKVAPSVARAIKGDLKRATMATIREEHARTHARFAEAWSSPEARATIGKIREELLRKKG